MNQNMIASGPAKKHEQQYLFWEWFPYSERQEIPISNQPQQGQPLQLIQRSWPCAGTS